MRSQINRRLKQKTEDFEKLYKRLGSEFDRQQDILKELLKEAQTELAKKMKTVATTKLLEEAAKEKLELNKKHYEDAERAKMVLNKLQTTYLLPTPGH